MAENVEETLNKMLMTTEFSLQLDESTLPGNKSLLFVYVHFIKGGSLSRIIVFTFPRNRYQRRISVLNCGGLFPEKKHSTYKHHLVLQMAPHPWLVATVDF